MANPWDRPPIPTQGDEKQDTTYAAVGHTLSQWEEVEVSLGHLYAFFIGRPKDLAAMREYGEGTVFRERSNNLERAATAYFKQNCNQHLEGDLSLLLIECRAWSSLRNDVAHGIVWPMHFEFHPSETKPGYMDCYGYEFCLYPPYYDPKRHTGPDPEDPDYGYTAKEMMDLVDHFIHLRERVIAYHDRVSPKS